MKIEHANMSHAEDSVQSKQIIYNLKNKGVHSHAVKEPFLKPLRQKFLKEPFLLL